jgi:hypothetical protein
MTMPDIPDFLKRDKCETCTKVCAPRARRLTERQRFDLKARRIADDRWHRSTTHIGKTYRTILRQVRAELKAKGF